MTSPVERPSVITADRNPLVDYEVVLVTYHSRDQLAGLLKAAQPDQRFVVVDNASGADGVAELVQRFPHGRWIDGGNRGFAAAANLGARSSSADYLVFGNPDSRPTPVVWQQLVEELRTDPGVGSVAAATINSSEQIEIGVGGWEPTPRRAVVHAMGLHRIFPSAGVYARPAVGDAVDLDWMTGACLAVRRQEFLQLGAFDERYFVYNEDMALGRTMRDAGLRQHLRTDLLVPHATGTSGGGVTKMPQQRGASMARYLRDHNGPLSTAVMRFALGSGMIPRMAFAAARGRMTLARQHFAYIKGIANMRSPYRPG